MGFFSFLQPQEAAEDDPTLFRQEKGFRKRRQERLPPGDTDKGPASFEENTTTDADKRRQLADVESKTTQIEQEAIRKIHAAVTEASKQVDEYGSSSADPQVVQVKDALDKGMLKPHQLISDVEVLLKKKKDLPGLTAALASGLNDLKASQEQRAAQAAQLKEMGAGPTIDPKVLQAHSEEQYAKAKQLRDETQGMGVLGKSEKLLEAKGLESQAKSLWSPEQQAETTQPQEALAPTSATPVQDYMKGLGFQKEDLIPRLHKALSGMVPKENWDDDVDPRSGLLRVLSTLDPNGEFALMVSQQLAGARQEDATEKEGQEKRQPQEQQDPRIFHTEMQIFGREERMRELYASLQQSPFMRTWPGIILYVLIGLVTKNPAFAARLLGGVDNREAVGAEIRGIQMDLRRLDSNLLQYQREDALNKKEAARRLQRKQDESDQRKWELAKMVYQHDLIIQRNAKKGNPETLLMKKLGNEFQRQLGLASKFSGEMQNEFADPTNRAQARANFNHYMRKAAEIDEEIRKLGGDVTEEEPEQEE